MVEGCCAGKLLTRGSCDRDTPVQVTPSLLLPPVRPCLLTASQLYGLPDSNSSPSPVYEPGGSSGTFKYKPQQRLTMFLFESSCCKHFELTQDIRAAMKRPSIVNGIRAETFGRWLNHSGVRADLLLQGGAWRKEVGRYECNSYRLCELLAPLLTLLPGHHEVSSFPLPGSFFHIVSLWSQSTICESK